jgi:hypothetical protein
MTMLKITYDDGESVTVATWTREYGFVTAGAKDVLERMTFEVIEPEVPEVDWQMPPLQAVPNLDAAALERAASQPVAPPRVCVTCKHPDEHTEEGCTATNCECYTAVYP